VSLKKKKKKKHLKMQASSIVFPSTVIIALIGPTPANAVTLVFLWAGGGDIFELYFLIIWLNL
jgi:hypothetical protein